VSAILLAVVAATGSVTFAASAGGFLYVLHFVVALAALIALRHRGDLAPGAFRTPAPAVILPLAFAGCAVLLIAGGVAGAAGGLGWLAVGALGYGARRAATR
jgi:basic amino acid/polyamine antiporter, APA family